MKKIILSTAQVKLISYAVGPITAIDRDGQRVSAYDLVDSHEILRAMVDELTDQLVKLTEPSETGAVH